MSIQTLSFLPLWSVVVVGWSNMQRAAHRSEPPAPCNGRQPRGTRQGQSLMVRTSPDAHETPLQAGPAKAGRPKRGRAKKNRARDPARLHYPLYYLYYITHITLCGPCVQNVAQRHNFMPRRNWAKKSRRGFLRAGPFQQPSLPNKLRRVRHCRTLCISIRHTRRSPRHRIDLVGFPRYRLHGFSFRKSSGTSFSKFLHFERQHDHREGSRRICRRQYIPYQSSGARNRGPSPEK